MRARAPAEPSTVIDLTGAEPVLVRPGRGSLEPFGLTAEAPELAADGIKRGEISRPRHYLRSRPSAAATETTAPTLAPRNRDFPAMSGA